MAVLNPKKVKYLIVHCTATAEGVDFTVADVDRWHRAQGWDGIGYHYLVYRDGSIHEGRSTTRVGAHCAGMNSVSIGVCYVGGCAPDGHTPKDTRTIKQKAALVTLLSRLKRTYPGVRIVGHNHFNKGKACPSFDADGEYRNL